MTRTKPARTVVKSVTASTTAPKSRTSLQASFAVSAVKLVTWPAIVPTVRLDSRGVTTTALATVLRAASAALPRTSSMLSSRRWAVVADSLVERSNTTVVVLAMTVMAAASALSSLGSVAQPAALHHGLAATAAASVAIATLALPHLGLRVVALVPVALTIKAEAMATAAAPRLGHLLHQLLGVLTATVTTELDTIPTLQRQATALLATVPLATALPQLLPGPLLVWVLFSRTTDLLEALLLLHLRHLAQRPLLHPLAMCLLLLLRLAMLLLRPLPHSKCSRILV